MEPLQIIFTGLRPGEKLHEDLFGANEEDLRPRHPLVSQVSVPPLPPFEALGLDPWGSDAEVLTNLRDLALSDGVHYLGSAVDSQAL